MTQSWYWADRGRFVEVASRPAPGASTCIGVSRMGSLRIPGQQLSLLVQLRGQGRIQALEGQFRLRAGDWLVLDRDSRPTVQVSASALCVGLSISPQDFQASIAETGRPLYVGRGMLAIGERMMVLRLWRQVMSAAFQARNRQFEANRLIAYLSEVQRDIHQDARRCPGRTKAHRQQVFSRLQRTRLFMEGHRGKPVRSSDLANLANLSACYYSRTFTAVYGERPQATAARIRLEYAAELLAMTSDPVASVALASGFENCCSFARAFRAHFGTTASNFRQENSRGSAQAKQRRATCLAAMMSSPSPAAYDWAGHNRMAEAKR